MPPLPHITADPAASPARRLELAADGVVSVAEAMAFLGLGHSEVYRLMDRGELAWAKVGRRRLVSRRGLTEFLASRMTEGR